MASILKAASWPKVAAWALSIMTASLAAEMETYKQIHKNFRYRYQENKTECIDYDGERASLERMVFLPILFTAVVILCLSF